MKKRRCSLCKNQVDEYITVQKIGGRIYLCHDCWMKSKLFVHHFTSITNPTAGKGRIEKVTEEE
jgi:ribosome-binding protein aMBF1 (putative translation factor)